MTRREEMENALRLAKYALKDLNYERGDNPPAAGPLHRVQVYLEEVVRVLEYYHGKKV